MRLLWFLCFADAITTDHHLIAQLFCAQGPYESYANDIDELDQTTDFADDVKVIRLVDLVWNAFLLDPNDDAKYGIILIVTTEIIIPEVFNHCLRLHIDKFLSDSGW